jgi:hypothetical protein
MPSPTQQLYEDWRLTPMVRILQYHSGVVGADMKYQPRENPRSRMMNARRDSCRYVCFQGRTGQSLRTNTSGHGGPLRKAAFV